MPALDPVRKVSMVYSPPEYEIDGGAAEHADQLDRNRFEKPGFWWSIT
jgi:hypothetical protein